MAVNKKTHQQKLGLLKNDNPHIYNLLKARFDRMRLIKDEKVKPTLIEKKYISATIFFGIHRDYLIANFDELCLDRLMTWSRTPEGRDFWYSIYNDVHKSIEEVNFELDQTFLKSPTLNSKTYNLWL